MEWIDPEKEVHGEETTPTTFPADNRLACPMNAVNHTAIPEGDGRFMRRVLLLAAAALVVLLLFLRQ